MEGALSEQLAPALSRVELSVEIDALPSAQELRECLWVDVELARPADGGGRVRWTQQLEALAMLAHVGRADALTAWTLLLDAQGQRAHAAAIAEARVPLRFRLVVHSSVYSDDATFTELREVLLHAGSWHPGHLSAAFASAMRDLDKMLRGYGLDGSGGVEQRGDRRVALCLKQHERDVPFQRRDGRPDMLARLVELAETMRTAHEEVACFRWTHVALNCQNTATLDVLYGHVERLLACGLRVEPLTIAQRARLVDVGAAARFWTRALATGGVQSLTVSTAMDAAAFQGLCSAIAVSARPLEVSYWPQHGRDGDPADAVSRWMWLAFALFRPVIPRNRLRVALDLSGVTIEDARAVERIVRACDPLAVLGRLDEMDGTTHAAIRVQRVVDLRTEATVFIGDGRIDSTVSTGFLMAPDEAIGVYVVEEIPSERRVTVIWPGAGLCWVRAADVVRRYETNLPPAPRIDHLTLRFSSAPSIEAAAILLRSVGASVRRLTLHCEYSRLEDEDETAFWFTVLLACPALERVDLTYAAVDSLTWLLNTAPLRLRVLSLDGVYLEDPVTCLGGLFRALADRDHPLAKSLREFHTQWVTVEPCFDALLAMLAANRGLEKCILSTENDASEWHEMRVGDFVALSVVPRSDRVERRCRRAFLSVFHNRSTLPETVAGVTSATPPPPLLDEHAMALVFAFAATKRRQCDVVYREW